MGPRAARLRPIDTAEAERRDVTVTTIADLQYGEGDRSRLLAAILAEIGAGRVAPSWARPSHWLRHRRHIWPSNPGRPWPRRSFSHLDGDLSVLEERPRSPLRE